MEKFELMESKFEALSEQELVTVDGGDWIGSDLINAIFDCGKQLGHAIGDAIWG